MLFLSHIISLKTIKHRSRIWLSKGHIGRNAVFAAVQAIITAISIFTAYRILTAEVGLEGVGLWSLVVAGAFIARAVDVSGAGALARFVALPHKNGHFVLAADYIHTVIITIFAINLIMGSLLFFSSGYLVDHFIEGRYANDARLLVPYVILSAIGLAPLAVTLSSAVDGVQRADQRAIVFAISSLVLLLATYLLVPKMGLIGFGLAQIIQNLFVIVVIWIILYQHLPTIGFFPWRWRKVIFLETISFGLKLQAYSLASLLTEPLVKYFLSQWGGLAMVGLYEFASRLVIQARGVVVAGTQPLMAAASAIEETNGQQLENLLLKSVSFMIWASVVAMFASILAAPVLGLFLLNQINLQLIYIVSIFAFAFGVNMFSVPFHFIALGRGIIFWNLLAQIITALLVWIGGILLGAQYGVWGILGSLAIGIMLGGGITLFGNAYALEMMPVILRLRTPIIAGIASHLAICLMSASFAFFLTN